MPATRPVSVAVVALLLLASLLLYASGISTGAYSVIQDEGAVLARRGVVNFTGAGVTCADDAGNNRTNCTIPGGGASPTTTAYLDYKAAVCQSGSAVAGFSLAGGASSPAAACITGTSTLYAVLNFNSTDVQSVQDRFVLPSTWTGTLDLLIKWSTSATSGSVVWQVQTACVADGETGDPAWNSASTVTDAAKGVANQWNDASIAAVDVTGCSAGEQLLFRFFRDPAHASDDLAADAALISLEWALSRTL